MVRVVSSRALPADKAQYAKQSLPQEIEDQPGCLMVMKSIEPLPGRVILVCYHSPQASDGATSSSPEVGFAVSYHGLLIGSALTATCKLHQHAKSAYVACPLPGPFSGRP